jgi:meso-butanediol dehydrogenase/(S,S)-butanediol dehydrogenase/diacetyl reductase
MSLFASDVLTEKVALVTGAASGIGLATAEKLLASGCKVLCCDINCQQLTDAVQILSDNYGDAVTLFCMDVTDGIACHDAVDKALACYGQLDILCNVAGISQMKHFAEITESDWRNVFAVNVDSVFFLSQAAMSYLLKTKGVIINIASTAGIAGLPYNAGYCASKGAVVQLSKALAVEYAEQGVRVNVICPGAVDTPLARGITPPGNVDQKLFQKMLPLVRPVASPQEIANQVVYLASDASRFITGSVIVIDGGQTAI